MYSDRKNMAHVDQLNGVGTPISIIVMEFLQEHSETIEEEEATIGTYLFCLQIFFELGEVGCRGSKHCHFRLSTRSHGKQRRKMCAARSENVRHAPTQEKNGPKTMRGASENA